MIYKKDNSTGRLSLYQTLQTRGAFDLEYFSIANKHFLAVANYYDGTHRLDSSVYQWNGKLFVDFQKLSTNGANHLTYFKIYGEKYLAVANYHDGSTYSTKSVIYKWSSGKFNRFQDISTEGAFGCTAFEINGDTFIAFANYYNTQHKYSVQSTVFKWSGGHFVKLQSLQTYGARDVKSFNVNGHTFLAFANYYSGSKHNTDSFIYKWNGNKFVLFQSIPTRGAIAWCPFVICGQTYLGVANQYGVPGLWSEVYQIPRDFNTWRAWYDVIWVQRSYLPCSGKLLQWPEVQHKQHPVQVGIEHNANVQA